jgi:hypothetical protein
VVHQAHSGEEEGRSLTPKKNPSGLRRRGLISTPELAGWCLCQALALGALASKFASAAHSFCLLASLLLGRLLEMRTGFHFPEKALTLHFLLQRAKGLFDIVVADDDLYDGSISIGSLEG